MGFRDVWDALRARRRMRFENTDAFPMSEELHELDASTHAPIRNWGGPADAAAAGPSAHAHGAHPAVLAVSGLCAGLFCVGRRGFFHRARGRRAHHAAGGRLHGPFLFRRP